MQLTEEATRKLQQTIGRITNLPTPPVVLEQINKVMSNPHASAYDVAVILSEDPAMSAKVLRLSNSAFYGLKSEITSVKQAIIILGMEAVRALVLSSAVFDAFKRKEDDSGFQDDFWRHSLASAFCTRLIVRALSGKWIMESDLAFSAGLLHDIGKLVLFAYLPDMHDAVRKHTEMCGGNDLKSEQEILGFTHGNVGGLLAQKWNLPPAIKDAVESHHYPQYSEVKDGYAYITHLADYIAHVTFDPVETLTGLMPMNKETLQVLKMPPDHVAILKEKLVSEYSKAETFLQLTARR